MRCKQLPFLKYNGLQVAKHDLETARQINFSKYKKERTEMMHKNLSYLDRKIMDHDYEQDAKRISELRNNSYTEAQEKPQSMTQANLELKSRMNKYVPPRNKEKAFFKKISMDSCRGGLAFDNYKYTNEKEPVKKML